MNCELYSLLICYPTHSCLKTLIHANKLPGLYGLKLPVNPDLEWYSYL